MNGGALLVAIGTELLTDGRQDHNGTTNASLLTKIGIGVSKRLILPDLEDSISRSIREGSDCHSLVIVTGGIGPTLDDVTREAISSAFGMPLVQDAVLLAGIKERYGKRGRKVSELSAKQALIPEGAEILDNPSGTAPGFLVRRPGDHLVFALPGVPHEMRTMMVDKVIPRIFRFNQEKDWKGVQSGSAICSRSLKIAGMTESDVQDMLVPLFKEKDVTRPTLLASPGEITLIVRGENEDEVESFIHTASRLAGTHAFTESPEESLEHVVGSLLEKKNKTLATAESCTGGLLSSLITRVAGSSNWFVQGWVTYANRSKISSLDIDRDIIEYEGAVSDAVARKMAESARQLSGADYALSLTGIAGPGGGTRDKPVGLVYIGLAGPGFTEVKKRLFGGDRELNRLLAARTALFMLRRSILEESR